jgi:hypothetical protein
LSLHPFEFHGALLVCGLQIKRETGDFMKALNLLSLLFILQMLNLNAHALSGHDQFKVELVKPWGEFGFRALGRGKNITEMRFDCSKTSDMGLVISVVNSYGKSSNLVLPSGKLGSDKNKCQESLKQYFANVYTKRSLASMKDKSLHRTVDLNFVNGGKTVSFH